MTITWHLEKRKIKDLKDYSKNPRKLTKDQATHLQTSLEKFGIIDKPFINHDNTIIGGHQRVRILKKLGHKEIEVLVPDRPLEDKEFQELNIRHNKNTGEWNYDILANDFDFADLLNWGFDAEELLGDMAEAIDPATEEGSEILEPGKDEDAITKLDDLYELNDHRLVCGDSTILENLEKLIENKQINFAIADPPYNVNYKYNDDTSDSKTDIEYYRFINTYVGNALGYSEILVITPGKVNHRKYDRNLIFDEAVWYKSNACTHGIATNFMCIEPILFLGKKIRSKKYSRDFFDIPQSQQKDVGNHTCPKPLELWKQLIEPMTEQNEIVLEMFMGSGTALIACEQLNRICYGIELSPAYCDIIVNRWKNYMTKNNRPFTIKRNGEPIQWPEAASNQAQADQKLK